MKTVIVIDDSKIYRHAITTLLRKLKFNVIEAENGLMGKRLFEQHSIDLALIDIVMPKLDGYALCREVKTNPDLSHIPVIFCSSKDTTTDKYWAFKQGGDYFISKPMTAVDIVRAIDTCLHSPAKDSSQPQPQPPSVTPHTLNLSIEEMSKSAV